MTGTLLDGPQDGLDEVANVASAPSRGTRRTARSDSRSSFDVWMLHLAVVGLLLAISVVAWSRVWVTGHPTTTVLCQCGDPGQAVWFMSWVPYAIVHGHNPLFTNAMFAGQGGANLVQSTSYLLPAFVLAPVTWLFGATASFNVALVLAPVVSGWAMFALARRCTTWVPAQVVGAVAYGFAPFGLLALQFGHLNFGVLAFLPLLVLAMIELCSGSRPVLAGAGLGLLLVLQFFTGTEPLAMTALAIAFGGLFAAAVVPRDALRRAVPIAKGLGVAALVAGVLLAYPSWLLLAGPRHVTGIPWPGTPLFGTTPDAVVDATQGAPTNLAFVRIGGYLGPRGPNISFVGAPLLIFLSVSVVVWYRRTVAWVVAVTGLFGWLCSWGAVLLPVLSGRSPWWLPWRYLQHVPLLQNVVPQRFALVVDFAVAMLLAISLDGWWRLAGRMSALAARRSASSGSFVRPGAAVMLGLVVAACLVPVARSYSWPLRMSKAGTPAWFQRVAPTLRAGTVVLTYPYASSGAPDAMYWQAQDGLRFRLVGGRALVPGADGRDSQHVDPLGGTEAVLIDASHGPGLPALPSPATVGAARRDLERWGVQVVVVTQRGRSPAWAEAFFTIVLGRAPDREAGAAVWYGLGHRAPLTPPTTAVAACLGTGPSDAAFASAPGCVVAASSGRKRGAQAR